MVGGTKTPGWSSIDNVQKKTHLDLLFDLKITGATSHRIKESTGAMAVTRWSRYRRALTSRL